MESVFAKFVSTFKSVWYWFILLSTLQWQQKPTVGNLQQNNVIKKKRRFQELQLRFYFHRASFVVIILCSTLENKYSKFTKFQLPEMLPSAY